MLFKRLRYALRRTSATTFRAVDKVSDPWSGSGCSYVSLFRKQLDEIAGGLSQADRPVRTRFNTKLNCVELHVPFGEAIAQVVVHGEMCSPETAIVTSISLSESAKGLFAKIMPFPVEFRAAT